MSFLLMSFDWARKLSGVLCLSIFAFFLMGKAQAVTIDFDDLDIADFIGAEGEWNTPLSNQYEALGVIFSDSAYLSSHSWMSLNSVTGPGFSFYFTDDLPTYVSMYVNSMSSYKVGVSAYGLDGLIETKITDGGLRGDTWGQSTPYRENQFVSFFVPEGISYIYLGSQDAVYVDNLSFGISVPEPGILVLFCLCMLMTWLRRMRMQ